jgi:hypothetical protein
VRVVGGPLSSYLLGSLVGMTKRRNSSPYPHPPSAFVRDLTQRGWRRCDAEALAMVEFCVQHADDDESLPTLARHAATALAKQPVLAGAIMRLAPEPGTAEAVHRLWSTVRSEPRCGLAVLWAFAVEFEITAELDGRELSAG